MAHILVAAADPDERGLIVFALRFAGHQVYSITNFSDLFKQIEVSHPDLILLDTGLPGLPGNTTWKAYLSVLKTYPVPLVLLDEADEEHAFGSDFMIPVKYSPRPISVDHLTRLVNHSLKMARK